MMQSMHLDRESALTAAEPLPASASTLLDLELDAKAATRSLGRDSVLFGLGTLVGKVVGFLVVPIFARLLAPEGFGRLDVLNTLVSSGLLIVMLGTDVATVRLYFDRRSPDASRRLFATWWVIAVGTAVIPTLILVVGASGVSQLLFGTAELSTAVTMVGVALLAGIILFVTLGILRATGRPATYAALEGGALTLNAVLAVVLLVAWRADPTAVMLALAVSWTGAAVIGLTLVRHSIIGRPSRSIARAILVLALPLAPAIVATWGADFFHRAYLLGVAGATEAAYLSMATRLGSIAMLVVAAAQLAWHPHAYRLGTSDAAVRQLAVEGRQIVVALVACVTLLGLFADEVLLVLGGPAYISAAPAVGMFLLSVLAVGLFGVASLASVIQRSTGDIGRAVVTGVAVAIVANVLIAPRAGAVGTAGAIALGQTVSLVIVSALGRRRLAIPFAWRPILLLVVLAAAVVLVSTITAGPSIGVRLVLAIGVGAALMAEGTLPAWLGSVGHRIRPPAGV
jgi:O-antigen/teichoic acid export membrane protein